jgi:cysteine protease ATG4
LVDVEWRKNKAELAMEHVKILSWFADNPDAPFSIHKFVRHGEVSCAKSPGEWFGPSAASRCIQLVSQDFEPANLHVSVTGDVDGVYKDQVERLSAPGPMNPTLLLIAKRLGHDNVNPQYYRSLKVFPLPSAS